jgi:lambda family phage portal protein
MAGIETGDYGEPIAYHIAKYHPYSLFNLSLNEWIRVPAFGSETGRRNVLHLLDMERPGQRRGVSMLSPVIEALKQLGRYTEAELMAAVVSGLFTAAITTDGDSSDEIGEDSLPGIVTGTSEEADTRNDIKLGNGTMIELAPGEKIESINPGRPNAAFDPFVLAILRQIGAALEIPMELLIKHFTASYSASRAALLEAWKFFRRQRAWLASDFCQPIYEEWLSEAVARGRISAPGFFNDPAVRAAYCGAEWNGPSPGQIDPLKEVNAAVVRVQNGFSTRAKETAELTGGDWDQNYRQRVKEEKMMREGGLTVAQPPKADNGGDNKDE